MLRSRAVRAVLLRRHVDYPLPQALPGSSPQWKSLTVLSLLRAMEMLIASPIRSRQLPSQHRCNGQKAVPAKLAGSANLDSLELRKRGLCPLFKCRYQVLLNP
jgi:hypothetical protein